MVTAQLSGVRQAWPQTTQRQPTVVYLAAVRPVAAALQALAAALVAAKASVAVVVRLVVAAALAHNPKEVAVCL